MTETKVRIEYAPLVLQTSPALKMDEEQFFELCRINDELRIERTAEGAIEVMPPTGGGTGNRNFTLALQLGNWTGRNGSGIGFDSSTGFILPNGAMRSPDVAWVKREHLTNLTAEQKEKFLPLCPEFVIELRSPSDHLPPIEEKMREYMENGASLGWLIDPRSRKVHVYKPNDPVQILENPEKISGDPTLPGFVLDLKPIWEPGF